jgi:hypothetical protein
VGFKGVKTDAEVVTRTEKDNLQLPTVAYGLGVWHLVNRREAKAREHFEKGTPPAQHLDRLLRSTSCAG